MDKSSTKPKGATSYKKTAFGIISRFKLLKLELEGTKKGLEYLEGLFAKEKNVEITPKLITKLHAVSFGWVFPDWAGKFRTVQVTFSNKEALLYYKLPELMLNLCHYTEKRMKHLPKPTTQNFIFEVVSLLAWFQHRFVYIHPFKDYNGRTARMLTILLLLRLGLPPLELKADTREDREQYLAAMQNADVGNYSLLEKLISQALPESFEKI